MDGAIAALVAKCAADMDAGGTLHGDVDEGGLGVPRAAFRPSGYLTDAGGMDATEYQKLVAAESKAVATTDRIAASRENRSRSASVHDDIASLKAALSEAQLSGQAMQSRGMGGHSLRGVDGQQVPFVTALAAEGVVMDGGVVDAEDEELRLGTGSWCQAGAGQNPRPEQGSGAPGRGSAKRRRRSGRSRASRRRACPKWTRPTQP